MDTDDPTPQQVQDVYNARCQAITDAVARMPSILRSFVLQHLDVVKQVDRLHACHMAYVLSFVEDAETLALDLLSLPAWQPPPPPKVVDYRQKGSGV